MSHVFLISDTHFSHANILKFVGQDGNPIRPFSSVEEMDEHMIEKWNSVVKEGDKTYHLGDVVIHKRALPILARLNGRKTLIQGNHDIFDTKEYLKYFKNVRSYRVLDQFIASHVPVHPDSLGRFKANVHGHLHGRNLGDSRYINISVEQTDYTPVELSVLIERIK